MLFQHLAKLFEALPRPSFEHDLPPHTAFASPSKFQVVLKVNQKILLFSWSVGFFSPLTFFRLLFQFLSLSLVHFKREEMLPNWFLCFCSKKLGNMLFCYKENGCTWFSFIHTAFVLFTLLLPHPKKAFSWPFNS